MKYHEENVMSNVRSGSVMIFLFDMAGESLNAKVERRTAILQDTLVSQKSFLKLFAVAWIIPQVTVGESYPKACLQEKMDATIDQLQSTQGKGKYLDAPFLKGLQQLLQLSLTWRLKKSNTI